MVVFYWQAKVVKVGKSTKRKAIGLYAAYTIAPIFLYSVVFMALVGIEELTNIAIIGEGYARSLFVVLIGSVAVTLVATLLFSIVVFIMKTIKINKSMGSDAIDL